MVLSPVLVLLIGLWVCFCVNSDESSSVEEEWRLRDELCQNTSVDQYEKAFLRYFNKTQKCYFTGERGPCPNNLVFHAEEDGEVYGQCDCDSDRHKRTLIYHPSTQTCYFIFTQAFCPEGEMVTLDRTNGQPKCGTNPCSPVNTKGRGRGAGKRSPTDPEFSNITEQDQIVFVEGKCVKLGSGCGDETTRLPSASSGDGYSGPLKIIAFTKQRILPYCEDWYLTVGFPVSLAAIKQTCSPGTLLSISGNCQANWVW